MNTQNLTYDELLNLYNNQQSIINNQQNILNKLSNKTKIDPYKILNISKNYDLSILKKAYIREAIKHHPDKGGNPIDFKNLVISYKVLLKKYNNNKSIVDHNTLKNNQKSFTNTQQSDNVVNLGLNKKFSKKQFNKMFDENKIKTIYDDGYEDWYNSTTDDKPTKFTNKVGMSTFNSAFEQEKINK
jgi:DnaJ-class molecular chaperone